MFEIRQDDLTGEAARALLALHLGGMHQNSPPGHVFALDLSGLQAPNVTVWTVWDGAALAGIGALKDIGDGTGELKSMRTDPRHLRRGVAAALLEHIIGVARRRGLRRLSLETGRGPAFEPALALYRKRGFLDGETFAEYRRSEFNQFLHLTLLIMTTFNTSREIPASIEQVFAAISDPERLARWWGPTGFTNTFRVCDFRKGGLWYLTMHGPDGKKYPNENVFDEIEAPTKVVVQHTSEPRYRLTISLVASGKGTVVSWSQAFEDPKVASRIARIVVPANDQNLEKLSAEVSRNLGA